ncbi:Crp/Fnr family transcriptional regulator [Aquimarina hainanensis]|uniref:Crp/Fnr family transcriptional regulator n=2 Tax=Aquimarina hainanensis TaxID=1578017 RepID=A0ABW5N6C4_9FLAO
MNLRNNSTPNCQLLQSPDEISKMFHGLFDFINLLMPISEHDQKLCKKYFKPYTVKKGTLLEVEGTTHTHHNFIVSGYMRNFHHDEKGKEITTDINDGPRFFTSYYSFIQQTISNENLHCITDCKLLRINRKDNEIITRQGQNSQKYVEKILQYNLESSRQRVIDSNTLTAKERYLKMLKNHPAILRNVPINYIASYLGINAGSLSRIRQEISP